MATAPYPFDMLRHLIALLLLSSVALVLPTASPAARAGVQDFEFESFEADYHLALDANGRTTLKTIETIVAVFPEFDQNRGILRALVSDYASVPTDIDVLSITDENGSERAWSESGDGEEGFRELTIAGDEYVHGRQTYVITYLQHNVTRYFPTFDAEEFYWDVNGTGWAQPFGRVAARLHVAPELAAAYTGAVSCYFGYEGSTDTCPVSVTGDDEEGLLFEVDVANIYPFQNVTIAVGFTPESIVARDSAYLASPFAPLHMLTAVLALLALGWVLALHATTFGDARGRRTIIAEYTPPAGRTLVEAAVVLRRVKRATAAQLIDFAVRRNIRIIESRRSSWFRGTPAYTLELGEVDGANGQERNFLRIFFGRSLLPGSQYRLSRTDVARSRSVYRFIETTKKATVTQGLRRPIHWTRRALPVLVSSAVFTGAVLSGILVAEDARGGALPFIVAGFVLIVEFVTFAVVSRTPLSPAGAEVRDHMRGLRLYIRLAEADRLRVLQSPEGAVRTGVSSSDPGQVVKLYERLLPYAVLFRLEKRWAETIGEYYNDSSPEWYSGSSSFNSAIFASSIGSLSSAAASSYSGSSPSSSSGGSGGGGSSGGGGGGGGGGGV